MTGKPQTGGLAALLRHEKNRKASEEQQGESGAHSEPEKMTLTEAHWYLGISFTTLSKLIKKGVLSYEADPLDGRAKLVKRTDLEELRNKSTPR